MSPDEIAQQLESMAQQAQRGCGQSFELYAARLSGMIDRTFPEGSPDREKAVAFAAGVYTQPAELEQESDGLCRHGIEPNHCPCGCSEA